MGYVRYAKGNSIGVGWRDSAGIRPVEANSLAEAVYDHLLPLKHDSTVTGARILPAVERGAKILCVALNYVDHAKEAKQPIPETPIIFLKGAEAMIADGEKIALPDHITQLDYEGELALLIGRQGYCIPKSEAWNYIAGVMPFNDVSARNLFKVKAGDKEHLDWFSGKCLDRSTPVGPEVTPLSEVRHELEAKHTRVRTLVNGEVRQDALIESMIFDIPTLVAFASSRIRLSPGDIIATGTPPGVGAGEGRYLNSGDVVRVEISGLPALENEVG